VSDDEGISGQLQAEHGVRQLWRDDHFGELE
jgi:hypothetical protein